VPAPLAGNIVRIAVQQGQAIKEGDLILILEAMKMETEVRSPKAGTVASITCKAGDAVSVGHPLINLA
jgi:oxaloacetate decarboxylase alpha subunit